MNFFTLSHKGQVRPNNEDYAESFQLRWCTLDGTANTFTALLLSDGMGGAAAGEYASGETIKIFRDLIQKELLGDSPEKFASSDLKKFICDTTVLANQTVHQKAKDNPDMEGMGATLVVGLIYQDMLTLGHVGDSRCYLLREGKFKQITHDHSFVQELVDQGKITADQAEKHPNKNVITRAMGVSPTVEAECKTMPLFVGDVLLLCSDGLSGYADMKAVQRLLKEKAEERFVNLHAISQELIDMANGGGGGDNVSVCLYRHHSA
ncbi:MAG: Stp1/IreP family PP2C-type Ser/Thr phosphatase [Candidatus Riflebacteria bacterium]|nr:Stp1/IreP family PP2C-type Ser/Thr phosphatase [Candidatus Riflebacteria bacterium]